MTYENLNELKFEFRLLSDGDDWGNVMEWWFTIADELYFNRDVAPPDHWQFRPSPMGPSNDDDSYPVNVIRETPSTRLVLQFGELLNRYARLLKYKGKDY